MTDSIPKALIPICGAPFVHHQLALLASEGVTDVVVCVGYLGEMLSGFVGSGSRWGLSTRFVDEGTELRGTGGALRLAFDEGALDETFFVLYGDSYLPIAMTPVWDTFGAGDLPVLMTVFRNEGLLADSNVVFRDGRVLLYDKSTQRPDMEYIDFGLSVMRRDIVENHIGTSEPVDLAGVYHSLSRAGLVAGLEVSTRFYEIGSPQGVADLEVFLAEVGPGVPKR